jgi:hypothetical protein
MVDGTSPLHRAFSLFIFNNAGQLLLQKRSSTKVGWCTVLITYVSTSIADPDPGSGAYLAPGSGMENSDPGFGMKKVGSGIRDKHPGSATLLSTKVIL